MSEGKCDRYLPTAHPGSGSRGTGASPGSSGHREGRGLHGVPSRHGHSPRPQSLRLGRSGHTVHPCARLGDVGGTRGNPWGEHAHPAGSGPPGGDFFLSCTCHEMTLNKMPDSSTCHVTGPRSLFPDLRRPFPSGCHGECRLGEQKGRFAFLSLPGLWESGRAQRGAVGFPAGAAPGGPPDA